MWEGTSNVVNCIEYNAAYIYNNTIIMLKKCQEDKTKTGPRRRIAENTVAKIRLITEDD